MKTDLQTIGTIILLTCSAILFSCEEKPETNTRSGRRNMELQAFAEHASASPANTFNPYDSVGIIHNDILAFVREKAVGRRLSEHETALLINQYINQQWGLEIRKESLTQTMKTVTENMDDGFRLFIESSALSEIGKGYFHEMIRLIERHVRLGEGFQYEDLKKDITETERNFRRDDRLRRNEKYRLSIAASIARHSAYYWTNGGLGPVIDTGENDGNGKISFKSIMRCVATITGDMVTALADVITGRNLVETAGHAAAASRHAKLMITYGMPGE